MTKPIRIVLLVGAIIITVLVGYLALVLPIGIHERDRAARHRSYDEHAMKAIAGLVQQFESEAGHFPEVSAWREALLTLDQLADKQAGIFDDSWGRPFQYRVLNDGGRFELTTLGRDGDLGGVGENEDIVVTGPDE